MKKNDSDGALAFIFWAVLLLPFGIYFLIKWIVKTLAAFCLMCKDISDRHKEKKRMREKNKAEKETVQPVFAEPKQPADKNEILSDKPQESRASGEKKKKKPFSKSVEGQTVQIGNSSYYVITSPVEIQAEDSQVLTVDEALTMLEEEGFDVSRDWEKDLEQQKADLFPPKESVPAERKKPVKSSAEKWKAKPSTEQPEKKTKKKEKEFMATVLGAGKYVFGEDIPMGKYNLKALSGEGYLIIQKSAEDSDGRIQEQLENFGMGKYCAKTYYGLSLPSGFYFQISGNIRFEITKAQKIEIE